MRESNTVARFRFREVTGPRVPWKSEWAMSAFAALTGIDGDADIAAETRRKNEAQKKKVHDHFRDVQNNHASNWADASDDEFLPPGLQVHARHVPPHTRTTRTHLPTHPLTFLLMDTNIIRRIDSLRHQPKKQTRPTQIYPRIKPAIVKKSNIMQLMLSRVKMQGIWGLIYARQQTRKESRLSTQRSSKRKRKWKNFLRLLI